MAKSSAQAGTVACPALLVGAAASGQGKTTLVAALARWWTRRGLRVQVFKCGPDFIDPGWHALASGQPVYQLDLWMVGEAACRSMLREAAACNDLILIEGVMGLYDGEPSSADLAVRLGLPVLAVIDAHAMAGTFGALAHGLAHYREGVRWAGVVANRVASSGHADMLRRGLREPHDWMGAIMRNADFSLPERHLGLMLAPEMADALARLDLAADALADMPLVADEGQSVPSRWMTEFPSALEPAEPEALESPVGLRCTEEGASPLDAWLHEEPRSLEGVRIAVARDAAFCFLYEANVRTLQALGAELVFFSPLEDAALPACDALWLPGGYPELHLEALQAQTGMRESIRRHVQSGRPVWAECGGMMALAEGLVPAGAEPEAAVPLWGVLPGTVRMHGRLQGLGPQALAVPGCDAPPLRGHTFHYSTLDTPEAEAARTVSPRVTSRSKAGEAFYRTGPQGNVRASYFHPWFASSPQAAAALFLPDHVETGA